MIAASIITHYHASNMAAIFSDCMIYKILGLRIKQKKRVRVDACLAHQEVPMENSRASLYIQQCLDVKARSHDSCGWGGGHPTMSESIMAVAGWGVSHSLRFKHNANTEDDWLHE